MSNHTTKGKENGIHTEQVKNSENIHRDGKKVTFQQQSKSQRKPLNDINNPNIILQSQNSLDNELVEYKISTKTSTVTRQSSGGTTTVTKVSSTEKITKTKVISASNAQPDFSKVTQGRCLYFSTPEWEFSGIDSCALINVDRSKKAEAKKVTASAPIIKVSEPKEVNVVSTEKNGAGSKNTCGNPQRCDSKKKDSESKVTAYITYFNCLLNNNNKNEPSKPFLKTLKVTPEQTPPGEHPRLKNIKKSLKRPHSRELQKVSEPEVTKGSSKPKIEIDYFKSGSSDQQFLTKFDRVKELYEKALCVEYMPEIVEHLLMKESIEDINGTLNSATGTPEIHRSVAINWIFKINDRYAGHSNLAHAAVRYFDKCLGKETIPTESLQLIAATCYWYVQKQHATPHQATSIAKHCGGAFSAEEIITTEKYVVRRLGWPTVATTCDDYVAYLVWLSKDRYPRLITQAARFLAMCSLINEYLASMRASVLAFAVVSLALKMFSDDRDSCLARIKKTPLHFDCKTVQSKILYTVEVLCQPDCTCSVPFSVYKRPENLAIAVRVAKIISAFKKTYFNSDVK